jgi:hypothetical protein
MNTDINWQLILTFIGATSGLLAVLTLVFRGIRNFIRRPNLVIFSGPNVGTWDTAAAEGKEVPIFVTLEAKSENGQIARECEAKARILEYPNGACLTQKEFGLHWADVDYSTKCTGAERVDIGITPQRLDVAFTVPNKNGESFIAIPLALATWGGAPQARLPEGEYTLEIMVSCQNGSRDKKKIKLISPHDWKELGAELI